MKINSSELTKFDKIFFCVFMTNELEVSHCLKKRIRAKSLFKPHYKDKKSHVKICIDYIKNQNKLGSVIVMRLLIIAADFGNV